MDSRTRGLEDLISYILAIGVFASLLVESVGLAGYVIGNGTTEVSFSNQWQTGGKGFFSYAMQTLSSLATGIAPLPLIALGIVILMLTPYLRVVASVLYFLVERNPKYVAISGFVFVVITISLFLR